MGSTLPMPAPPPAAASQMSPELQAAARKLAEGGDEGSLPSKGTSRRHSRATPSPSIAASGGSAASLAHGLRVEVSALAGYDSPGGGGSAGSPDGGSPLAGFSGGASPVGPSFSAGQRPSRLAPAGHAARASSLGLAGAGGAVLQNLFGAAPPRTQPMPCTPRYLPRSRKLLPCPPRSLWRKLHRRRPPRRQLHRRHGLLVARGRQPRRPPHPGGPPRPAPGRRAPAHNRCGGRSGGSCGRGRGGGVRAAGRQHVRRAARPSRRDHNRTLPLDRV
jgi:hypothetical protein